MLSWIREQLIGTGAVIRTPFGMRRLTYADYVASGRFLRHVEQVLQQHVLPWYANTHTEDSYTGARTTHLMHEAADYVKSCVGADSTCKIVFSGTGSTGAIKRLQEVLGLSVPSNLRDRLVSNLDPLERPVVYVGPYEHHSNEVSWRETIAEVIEIPLSPTGFIDFEVLHNALHDPRHAARPRIGSFSAASNVTGLISDTRRIARMLHDVRAYACFDFAASAPYLPIDMKPGCPDGYDAIFISPHKFVGGPGSSGVLIFNEAMYRITTPSTPGGGTVDYVSSRIHHYVPDIEAREDAGTPGIVQKMRAALAFWVKEQVGVEIIAEREKHYIRTALQRLRLNPRIQVLGNLEARRLAVVSFLIRSGRHLAPSAPRGAVAERPVRHPGPRGLRLCRALRALPSWASARRRPRTSSSASSPATRGSSPAGRGSTSTTSSPRTSSAFSWRPSSSWPSTGSASSPCTSSTGAPEPGRTPKTSPSGPSSTLRPLPSRRRTRPCPGRTTSRRPARWPRSSTRRRRPVPFPPEVPRELVSFRV